MNILEEFWYGNIEPAEYDISSSKEYKELLQLISKITSLMRRKDRKSLEKDGLKIEVTPTKKPSLLAEQWL